jgi:hypothetical protein
VDLKAIRDHLRLARLAVGQEHPLSARIKTVERNLTPGDSLWRDDAVNAEIDLLAILAELEQLPKLTPPGVASGAGAFTGPAAAQVPPGVNEAIKQIGAAIELL